MGLEFVSEVDVKLINTNASDDMVAMAAWVSHDQDNELRLEDRDKVGGLIKFLYRNKHMSPFEHGQFITKNDVPLFVRSEWHRHRTQSYNEVSTRYTEMEPRFWMAPHARVQRGKPGDYYFEAGTDDQTALYRRKKQLHIEEWWNTYQDLLNAGIAREQAIEEAPLSLMTQFYATMNPRNLMAFIELRNEKHARAEIRQAAEKLEAILAETMPLTYAAFNETRISREKVEHPVYTVTINKPEAQPPSQAEIARMVKKTLENNRKLRA